MHSYAELLLRPEWKHRRHEMLNLNGACCYNCSQQRRDLEIHHKFYRHDRKPWDYPDDALVVLCRGCHQKNHDLRKVPWFDAAGRLVEKPPSCRKCGGGGYIPAYWRIHFGICFRCWGSGYDLPDPMLPTVEEFLMKERKETSSPKLGGKPVV